MLRFDLKYPLAVPALMLILGIVAARGIPPSVTTYFWILPPAVVVLWLVKCRIVAIFLGFFSVGFGLLLLKNQREQLFYLKLANARALMVQAIDNPRLVEVKWVIFEEHKWVRCEGDLAVKYDECFSSNKTFIIHPQKFLYTLNSPHSTLNPPLSTLHSPPYTLNSSLSPLNSLKLQILSRIFGLSKKYLKPKAHAWYLALIWGERSELEKTDKLAFQKLGLAHVISVSGMHLALVFNLLSWPFTFFEKRNRKVAKYRWLLLPLVWVYTYLTPMSPPVVRAAISLTLMVLAKSVFSRRVRGADVYFSVLFIYLLWDPLVLFDLGFQLSLMAMWGIVFLVPDYLRRFEESHSLVQWFFNTVVVSIICTLTTIPIIFKEFEQLSLWFLVGNLLLMPFFNWLIYGYVIFFILGFSDFLLQYFAWCINAFIDLIDALMLRFSHLPSFNLYSPQWGWTEFLLLLLVVVFWTFYREEKIALWKNLCLLALFVLSVEYSIALYICS